MNYSIQIDHEQMSRAAAEWLFEELTDKPDSSILVATGNTPIDCYRYLAAGAPDLEIDTSLITAVQLDEYLGIGPDDPRSLDGWMDRALIKPLRIPDHNVIRFDATAKDPVAAIERYDRAVAGIGGIDIAILGLGPNGHLGFNEPPATEKSPTRVVDLTPASLASNAVYWGENAVVPTRAMTAGMTTILGARKILLLVSGAHKATILRKTVSGDITPDIPSSLLRLEPHKTWIFADDAAWGEIE
jgi:glucosamine-6-phosphate deaminase